MRAQYLGVTEMPSGAAFDVWIARRAKDAKDTADALNASLADQQGVTEAVGAEVRRNVVAALDADEAAPKLAEARAIDQCIDES